MRLSLLSLSRMQNADCRPFLCQLFNRPVKPDRIIHLLGILYHWRWSLPVSGHRPAWGALAPDVADLLWAYY